MVTNAGRRNEDLAWFKQKLEEWNASDQGKVGPVEHEVLENWGLVALQGKANIFDSHTYLKVAILQVLKPCLTFKA